METEQNYKIGDCVDLMKELPDNYIDLVVTSPPYDNLRDYGGYVFDFAATAKQLYRTVKNGGVVVWVVGDATIKGSETGTSFKQALHFKNIGFNLHDTMIYQKSGVIPSTVRYYPTFEYMFIFSKGKPNTFNPIMDRKNRWRERWGKTRVRRGRDGNMGKEYESKKAPEYGMRFNIWKYAQGGGYGSDDKHAYKHPAIFPEQLVQDHILSWSNEGDLVLDPLLGSGTTLKMCKQLNRNGLGFECNPEYEPIIKQRIGAVESIKLVEVKHG